MTRTRSAIVNLALAAAAAFLAACAAPVASTDSTPNATPAPPTEYSALGVVTNTRQISKSVSVSDIIPAKPSTDPVLARFEHPTGVVIEDLRLGDGQIVLPGSLLTFRHRAFLPDSTQFEESYTNPQPPTQNLAKALKGLREGMPGAKVGSKRRLIIPPDMAFGMFGRRKNPASPWIVPPNSPVIFEVEVLDVQFTLQDTKPSD